MRAITFQVSSIECALPIAQVREILEPPPVTRVPGAPAAFRGVTNLRGQVVPVLDVAARLGIPAAGPGERSCLLVTDPASSGGVVCALAVDGVRGLEDFEPDDAKPPPALLASADWLAAIVVRDDRLVLLVDLERLLDDAAIRASRPLPPADMAALRGATVGRSGGTAQLGAATDRELGGERATAPAAGAARATGSSDAPGAATAGPPVQRDSPRTAVRSAPSPGAARPAGTAQTSRPAQATGTASRFTFEARVSSAGRDARKPHGGAGEVGRLAGPQGAAVPPRHPEASTAEPERDPSAAGASRPTASRSGGGRLAAAALAAGAALVLLVALCRPGGDRGPGARARAERRPGLAAPEVGGTAPLARTASFEPAAPPPVEVPRPAPPTPVAAEAERPAGPASAAAPRPSRPLRPGDVYVVVRGDSLWSISERMLLDPHRWPRLYDANRDEVANPDLIRPGQRITVPEPAPLPALRPRRTPAPRRETRRIAR